MADLYTSPTTINMTGEPTGLFRWLNNVTDYWFSNVLVIALWILFFSGYISVRKDDYSGGVAVASYVTMVLCLIGWLAEIVGGMTFGIVVGLSLVSTAWLLADKGGGTA